MSASPPEPPPRPVNPCQPSPCGPNAQCEVRGETAACSCLANYIGSPPNCRPECTINAECPPTQACVNQRCADPCANVCGYNAQCSVINHTPVCACLPGFTGDPFTQCQIVQAEPVVEVVSPCEPSPCGANAICKESNGVGSCLCLPDYYGNPYESCRPECVSNSECSPSLACVRNKCTDPCPGVCGTHAQCHVINHVPQCTCDPGFTGNAYQLCSAIPLQSLLHEPVYTNPCQPSPCGPNSQCREVNHQAVCSCLPNYFGSPPACRPECTVNTDCPLEKACFNQKCVDPCPGTCGQNANCRLVHHLKKMFQNLSIHVIHHLVDLIHNVEILTRMFVPNAECRDGVCVCLPDYYGDGYVSCRPECVLNNDCPRNKACIKYKCKNPCTSGTCGEGAICDVVNHAVMCTCPPGTTGSPFVQCKPIQNEPVYTNPCQPSPCGPNSQCREINGQAVCSCLPNYFGSPPSCRPECTVNTDCPLNKACVNQKCVDPCPGSCGQNANCRVINHIPICSCKPGFTGQPKIRCSRIPAATPPPQEDEIITNPCYPSPCGPYSQCRDIGGSPSCSCLPNYIGSPPNCRPECTSNATRMSNDRACINEKCQDPCPGSCGYNAECKVINHTPICTCPQGYVGDAFSGCYPKPPEPVQPVIQEDTCNCVQNAECRDGVCVCLPDYYGDGYVSCRPEWGLNSDCPSNKACIRNKCKNPCVRGTCGEGAICDVVNHAVMCTCPPGTTGSPFAQCKPVQYEPVHTNPCQPSPCGPNSQCREINNQAVCSCLPNYFGSPPACRPECTVNSDCLQSKACFNQKCVDPCPGTCGQNANCRVINHSPICTCKPGFTGDALVYCNRIPPSRPLEYPPEHENPCVPSPCGPYAQCRDINGSPSCSCLPNYIGAPPNCRPECVQNSECPYDKACIREKCADPCPGSCGYGAVCTVINHSPICTCPEGYIGDAFSSCYPKPPEPVQPVIQEDTCRYVHANLDLLGTLWSTVTEYLLHDHSNLHRNMKTLAFHHRVVLTLNAETSMVHHHALAYQTISELRQTVDRNVYKILNVHMTKHVSERDVLIHVLGLVDMLYNQLSKKTPATVYPTLTVPHALTPTENFAPVFFLTWDGVCVCLPDYYGDGYVSCRPECILNNDCPNNKACIRNKCKNPCTSVACGEGANCDVIYHAVMCTCPPGTTGSPFIQCKPVQNEPVYTNPCQPSPCGPNSQCREVNHQAVCSCLPNYFGSPPNCRPECTVNSDCPLNKACFNQKCTDPCPGTCGQNANCRVTNHNPHCSCKPGFTGDPVVYCNRIPPRPPPQEDVPEPVNPCYPSPCGPYSQCRDINGSPSCSCLPNYIGAPPNCKPECLQNSECPYDK
ncbi:LOW QUALITY PROTEIN: neurogenic locus notch homolog protein 1-like, partial [Diaphorina citri]|uniref:LOW QUALITY PROTEIN: neurogenic locus notch homolog protein 1-like n=1 Tax=Diaphorina citri TaxID=121845 RepID=A0A3Q0J6G4_DIACI